MQPKFSTLIDGRHQIFNENSSVIFIFVRIEYKFNLNDQLNHEYYI